MKTTLMTGVLATTIALTASLAEAQGDPRSTPSRVDSALQQSTQYQWTALHWAVRRGEIDQVRTLAGRGQIEARDSLGRTPLHIAVLSGHDDIVQLLIESGADVNARDQWQVTPLRRVQILEETRGWDRAGIAQLLRNAGGVKADMAGVRD